MDNTYRSKAVARSLAKAHRQRAEVLRKEFEQLALDLAKRDYFVRLDVADKPNRLLVMAFGRNVSKADMEFELRAGGYIFLAKFRADEVESIKFNGYTVAAIYIED